MKKTWSKTITANFQPSVLFPFNWMDDDIILQLLLQLLKYYKKMVFLEFLFALNKFYELFLNLVFAKGVFYKYGQPQSLD